MRIVAGTHRGRKLAEVGAGDPEAHLRPTADRVREALFSTLQDGRWGDLVTGAHVLDLFAGTGALGLEALSRGAASATFVDNGTVARGLITDNLARLGLTAPVLECDVGALPPATQPCSLVFLDPPYGQRLGLAALKSARAAGWIAHGAVIVWEEDSPQVAPRGTTRLDQRRHGDTWITLLKANA